MARKCLFFVQSGVPQTVRGEPAFFCAKIEALSFLCLQRLGWSFTRGGAKPFAFSRHSIRKRPPDGHWMRFDGAQRGARRAAGQQRAMDSA